MTRAKTKKYFIKTYGCQMNVYDSERMAEALLVAGYQPVDVPEAADMVILNTCHIREKAAEKVYSELGRLKPLKQANGDMIIGVAGCVAQAEGEEMLHRAPLVDMVFGPQTYQQLPDMTSDLDAGRRDGDRVRIVRTEFPAEEKFAALNAAPRRPITRAPTAFVTVQEGCDKFCTFCVVPYTRGAEVSRATADIVDEANALAAQGVCEITLLGQNVNAWRDRETGLRLDGLLEALAQIEGIERLRFTTSHPRDMDAALIAAHGHNGKLMPYLHLPVQSGSDPILKAMNRRHTRAQYLDLVAAFRNARADLALSSDFIVGFPGETDADFDATMDLVAAVSYAQA
ncbi:MAG: tRNA (N6-isopentenyl adenosine(37)-C2)-methylthiotransferase MiaB, partial [Pseudomonadota bacterium]|nr:tRNA (N6-isopentenyl adenosine(37)-C2)-methylthiotransferase MiaB [Pseudomonadota bacterium]